MRAPLTGLVLGLLVLGACQSHQPPLPTPAEGSVVISDRLSNQRVNCFAEDRYGHIWMGTFRGLNKYTPGEFQHFFCMDDQSGLPDNQINALHSAQDGTLWVATVNGVARHTQQDGFHRVGLLSDNRNISQILETHDGKLLFSNGMELFLYDAAQEALRPVLREFNAFGTPSALVTADDRLWVITGGGFLLNCYSTQDFSLQQTYSLPHQVYHLCDAGQGELWLSGMGQLSILDIRSGNWKPLPDAVAAEKHLMSGDIDILFAIDGNSLLMNAIGKGFFLYNRTHETVLFQDHGDFPLTVPDTEVRTIFRDSHGNLWFGTTDQGYHVSYQGHSQFGTNKYLTEALRNKNVISLCPDKAGALWITTLQDGLFRYDLSPSN